MERLAGWRKLREGKDRDIDGGSDKRKKRRMRKIEGWEGDAD